MTPRLLSQAVNPIIQELEHRDDHERQVGHIVMDQPRFSLLASSHTGFLVAAGREVLRRLGEARA